MSAIGIFRQSSAKVVPCAPMRHMVPSMRHPSLALVLLLCASLSGCSGCYSAPRPNLTEVMIAARDLPAGITIQRGDIKIVGIPSSDLPPHAPRKKSEVFGHNTLVPIPKGAVILSEEVSQ